MKKPITSKEFMSWPETEMLLKRLGLDNMSLTGIQITAEIDCLVEIVPDFPFSEIDFLIQERHLDNKTGTRYLKTWLSMIVT